MPLGVATRPAGTVVGVGTTSDMSTPDGTTDVGHAETPGINAAAVTGWLAGNTSPISPPLTFTAIAGGHSNLTYTVSDSVGRRWVLRRPPLGQVLATAHDMEREHRIISALDPTNVPVAPVVGLCVDESVNGAPFYVMDFVDGTVVRDLNDASALTVAQRQAAGTSLIDVLARIHAVDPAAVGLGDLARHDGYIERQLKRWNRQFEASRTRDLPIMEQVHADLCAAIPEQGPASIVHGDYRLDNCMLGPDGSIVAVLDWELCTLGDPLADLGLLLVYWSEPGENGSLAVTPATGIDGFPTRAELVERYGAATGRDTSAIDFYVAFGYWKLACIIEGVFSRYSGGSMGAHDAQDFSGFGDTVIMLAEAARAATDRL
jgi:aminoglycoside phosphotransferase (APT) family kinase protein